jgi:hypothetical protein
MTAVGAGADEDMAASVGRSGIAAGLLPYLVHVCHRCGYAGGVEDFAVGLHISAKVRVRVWRELAPTLAPSVRMPWLVLTAPGSAKYEGAAKVAEWRGADRLTVGDLWIRAARCALDERDHEAERYYARLAARWYARALECGDVDPEERAGMAYGLGELWVHIGDRQTAAGWFRQVNDEVIDPKVQRCLVEAAARQIGIAPTDRNT